MTTAEERKATSEDYYFDPNARFSAHEVLIKDRVRQQAYSGSIWYNKNQFEGKTVLIVGCGLGLLALQAAKEGGAKKVIGLDTSKIVEKAREVAEENGLSDICTFVQGDLCDGKTELPVGDGMVDIIICEWVSHLLVNDSIIKQLIAARDRYLCKTDGTIIPNSASLHMTSCSDRHYKQKTVNYWDNIYGFRMLPMKKLVLECPIVSAISPTQVTSTAATLITLDAMTMTEEDISFTVPYSISSTANHAEVHYFIMYITLYFKKTGWEGFTLYTSPSNTVTNYQQTCFSLQEDLPVNKNDVIEGEVTFRCVIIVFLRNQI